MKKNNLTSIVAAMVLILSGCSSGDRLIDPAYIEAENGEFGWQARVAAAVNEDIAPVKELREKYAALAVDAPERRGVRQQIVRRTLTIIDQYQNHYKAQLQRDIASGKTMFDFAGLGVGFATTIAGGEVTKTILGATTTLLKGSELAISTNYFNNQAVLTLLAQMDASRDTRRAIIERQNQRGDSSYDLWQADDDLLAYLADGSIVNALTTLAKETGAKAELAKVDATKAKVVPFAANLRAKRDQILDWLGADPANRAPMFGSWLDARTTPNIISPVTWINDPETPEADLDAAIRQFTIPTKPR